MSMARVFALGVIILTIGVQLRVVDTFVLNEEATKVVNKRLIRQPAPEVSQASFSDPYFTPPPVEPAPLPTKRSISPPRWLANAFISIGAILIFTCPLRR